MYATTHHYRIEAMSALRRSERNATSPSVPVQRPALRTSIVVATASLLVAVYLMASAASLARADDKIILRRAPTARTSGTVRKISPGQLNIAKNIKLLTLEVQTPGTNPDFPAWKMAKTINEPEKLQLRWSPNGPALASAQWQLAPSPFDAKDASGASADMIASGKINSVPAKGYGYFQVALADHLPAKAPASPQKLYLRLVGFDAEGKAAGVPSASVVLTYQASGNFGQKFAFPEIEKVVGSTDHGIELKRAVSTKVGSKWMTTFKPLVLVGESFLIVGTDIGEYKPNIRVDFVQDNAVKARVQLPASAVSFNFGKTVLSVPVPSDLPVGDYYVRVGVRYDASSWTNSNTKPIYVQRVPNVTVTLTKIHCIEETDESSASDEIYVVAFTADMGGISQDVIDGLGLLGLSEDDAKSVASKVGLKQMTKVTNVYEDFDKGEDRHPNLKLWGLNNKPRPLPNPEDVIFLVAMMENDNSSHTVVRDTVDAMIIVRLVNLLGAGFDSSDIVDELRQTMFGALNTGALAGAGSGIEALNIDERLGYPTELTLTVQDRISLLQGTSSIGKQMTFEGSGGKYKLYFRMGIGE